MAAGMVGSSSNILVGGEKNERSVTYHSGGAVHHLRFFNQVNPDVLLAHQSRMVGFYLKLRSKDELSVIDRSVKTLVLRDHGALPGTQI